MYEEDFDDYFQDLDATQSDEYDEVSSCSEYEGDSINDTRFRNFVDVTPIALMSIKYEVSPRAATSISNATLVATGQVKTSEEAKEKFFDHRKVFRKVNDLCLKNESLRNDFVKEEQPDAICFDGKKDFSLVKKTLVKTR